MKAFYLVCWLSGPLLLASSQATPQAGVTLEVSQIQKITDASQGGFRPFIEFAVAGQVMRGLLDTGSSDLNIPETGSDFCRSQGEQCDGRATGFKAGSLDTDRNKSQIRDLNEPLNATFTGGAAFRGTFITSPLQVTPGGRAVTVQMGLVESGSVPPGEVSFPVVGLGPVQGESADKLYPNVPARFKRDGLSKSNAYGIHLGDFRSPDNGTLVWGGFDAAKVEGELKAAPLVETSDGTLPSFVVDLSSVGLAPSRNTAHGNDSVQQDSSTTEMSVSEDDDAASFSGEFTRSAFTRPRIDNARARSYGHTTTPLSRRDILRRQQNGNLLSNDAPPVVWVDTGVPEIILPAGTLNALGKSLGAQPGPRGEFLADCSRIRGMDLTLGINNDSIRVRVPLDSIIAAPDTGRGATQPSNAGPETPKKPKNTGNSVGGGRGGNRNRNNGRGRGGDGRGSNVNNGDGQEGDGSPGAGRGETCQLALSPVQGNGPLDIPILGAPALQRMVVVFDMDSKVLMMAQAKVNETKTDIREYVPAGRS